MADIDVEVSGSTVLVTPDSVTSKLASGEAFTWHSNSGDLTIVFPTLSPFDAPSPYTATSGNRTAPVHVVNNPSNIGEHKYIVAVKDSSGHVFEKDPVVIIVGGT